MHKKQFNLKYIITIIKIYRKQSQRHKGHNPNGKQTDRDKEQSNKSETRYGNRACRRIETYKKIIDI